MSAEVIRFVAPFSSYIDKSNDSSIAVVVGVSVVVGVVTNVVWRIGAGVVGDSSVGVEPVALEFPLLARSWNKSLADPDGSVRVVVVL